MLTVSAKGSVHRPTCCDKVGERQLALAKRFRAAGLINEAELAAVQAAFRPVATAKYEMREE